MLKGQKSSTGSHIIKEGDTLLDELNQHINIPTDPTKEKEPLLNKKKWLPETQWSKGVNWRRRA